VLATREFPHCCGIRVVYQFPETIRDINAFDVDTYTDAITRCEHEKNQWGYPGILLIALTEAQSKSLTIREALSTLSYHEMISATNPKTGNKIKLYGKSINQPKKVANRIRSMF